MSGSPILVWGAGAMGGTIGACLAEAGHPVHFVDAAEAHVTALNRTGLHVTGPIRDFQVPATAFSPATVTDRYERVLLCVKAHHTRPAVEALRPHLSPDGFVVSIQNGLNEAAIAETVGAQRTIGAFVNFGADYLEPGVIHWGGRGAVVLGELDGTSTERLDRLVDLLGAFEPEAKATNNIQGYLWGKLAYAALLFATAVTDDPIADVLASTPHRPALVRLAKEVTRVAEAAGITMEGFDGFDPAAFAPSADPSLALASLDELVAFNRRSAKTHSGIWRDLAVRKRRTEVDAQLLPVVEEAHRLGIATPLTEALIETVHDVEEGRRALAWKNLDELAALSGQREDRGR